MTFKDFMAMDEKFGHPDWGGNRRRNNVDMIRLSVPKAVTPFTGVKKIEHEKYKRPKVNFFKK